MPNVTSFLASTEPVEGMTEIDCSASTKVEAAEVVAGGEDDVDKLELEIELVLGAELGVALGVVPATEADEFIELGAAAVLAAAEVVTFTAALVVAFTTAFVATALGGGWLVPTFGSRIITC